MVYHDELSENLRGIFDDAVGHGVRVLESGEMPLPYLLLHKNTGEKILTVFTNDSEKPVERGVSDARQAVIKEKDSVVSYVIGYDGRLKFQDGTEQDALILEGGERDLGFAFLFAQQYRSGDDGEIVLLSGDGIFIAKTEGILD